MEGVPVGRPLFNSSKEERVSSCYRTLRLRADEQGSP